jgi:hypothetical protein
MRSNGVGASGTMARILPVFSYYWLLIKIVDLCYSINSDAEMQDA